MFAMECDPHQIVKRTKKCCVVAWWRDGSDHSWMSGLGRVSRAPHELCAARNCTRDEGGPFEFGDQEPISSHRKLLRAKAVVVSVAETPGQDFGRHGRERRAQAHRGRSIESR